MSLSPKKAHVAVSILGVKGNIHLVGMHPGGGLGQASYTFPCVLHAKRGWVGPDSMLNCVCTKWKVPKYSNVAFFPLYEKGGGGGCS